MRRAGGAFLFVENVLYDEEEKKAKLNNDIKMQFVLQILIATLLRCHVIKGFHHVGIVSIKKNQATLSKVNAPRLNYLQLHATSPTDEAKESQPVFMTHYEELSVSTDRGVSLRDITLGKIVNTVYKSQLFIWCSS